MKHAVLTCLALALLATPMALAAESAATPAGDEELQGQMAKLAEAGVRLTACKWRSDQYEVSDKLTELGIDVKYMGKALTGFLKSEANVMVF